METLLLVLKHAIHALETFQRGLEEVIMDAHLKTSYQSFRDGTVA